MYVDNELVLSDSQALTATADSTNLVDLGVDRDLGKGEPMALVISVVTAADVANADETYRFQLETDSATNFSSSAIIADATIAGASLTAGSRHVLPLGQNSERYLQGVYTLGGTTPSVTITADIKPMSLVESESTYYASGFTVS